MDPVHHQGTDEDDLDAAFAELLAAGPTQARPAVGRRASELGVPPVPVFPPQVGAFDTYCPAIVRTLIADENDPRKVDIDNAAIMQIVIQRGGLSLAQLLKAIRVRYLERAGHGPADPGLAAAIIAEYDTIVETLMGCRPALDRLRTLLSVEDLVVPAPQAAAVMCFHDAYPQFWSSLDKTIVIKFNSSDADSRGGGLFKDNVVHMSALPCTPPGAFVRLFVHELGHASFERILLENKNMPVDICTYAVPDLADPHADPGSDGGGRRAELLAYWNAMTPQAKLLYEAWLTLRHENGKWLVGLDLWEDPKGNRLWPGQRRPYQANSFSEFCAETFMLFAMGDLHDHVQVVLDNPEFGADVQMAWRKAWRVLTEVAGPILGPRAHQ